MFKWHHKVLLFIGSLWNRYAYTPVFEYTCICTRQSKFKVISVPIKVKIPIFDNHKLVQRNTLTHTHTMNTECFLLLEYSRQTLLKRRHIYCDLIRICQTSKFERERERERDVWSVFLFCFVVPFRMRLTEYMCRWDSHKRGSIFYLHLFTTSRTG